ncbi:OmpA family protein [Trinickia sp. LjRoot230]|uniref:OmpA family protein n=1 Tax=Trinickia sp. LjRoot230 TaxID=3342288 RepID=UPI003ED02DB9
MKPDSSLAPHRDSANVAALERLGYPFRAVLLLAAALVLATIWLVLPVSRGVAGMLTGVITLAFVALIVLRTRHLAAVREHNAQVLAALGAATTELPVSLRTRMPFVLVTGDGLPALFNRTGAEERLVHVGDGAIWLRVSEPQALPRTAVALRQWRDGRAPDGVVLSVAPALHASEDVLTQKLRLVRQAVADASRMLNARLPGYVAVYQRLTQSGNASTTSDAAPWHGVSSATRLAGAHRFEAVIQAAECEVRRAGGTRTAAARAAGLASLVGWTQRVIIDALTDRRQPATPWTLFGAGWIDCGPASGPDKPWERDVAMQLGVGSPSVPASALPWPLPEPLIEAMPRRRWMSPRRKALAHAIALTACAATLAIWGAATNNAAMLARIGSELGRYSMIPASHDTAKRDAFSALVASRNELERYARIGVPLRLSFGMYRGGALLPALNRAIASYQPPPAPPTVVTLDSMSLFDSGRAQLKAGSTRAMVGALDMIKAHRNKRIVVAGHTDNTGHAGRNLALSIARAGAVRDWLTDASGIPPMQFAIQGYGDTRPIASNATADGRAKNRRVEITLVPDAPPNSQ